MCAIDANVAVIIDRRMVDKLPMFAKFLNDHGLVQTVLIMPQRAMLLTWLPSLQKKKKTAANGLLYGSGMWASAL